MGCGQSIQAAVVAAIEKQAEKNKPKLNAPEVGAAVYLPDYGQIGTVKSIDEDRREIMLEEIGSKDESSYKFADYKGNTKWQPISDFPALAPFGPSFEVTASFRGSEVNGFVTGTREDELTVHFRPDEAHSMDKTNWRLGSTERYKAADLKLGHTGAERPRNRTSEEIKADENRVKGFGVAFIYCGGCGQGIWQDPCGCYTGGGTKGIFCQKCGTKGSSGNTKCCGALISTGAQNQGYPKVLSQQ